MAQLSSRKESKCQDVTVRLTYTHTVKLSELLDEVVDGLMTDDQILKTLVDRTDGNVPLILWDNMVMENWEVEVTTDYTGKR